MAQCDAQVLAHPTFQAIQKELPSSGCGVLEYDPKVAEERLSKSQDYVAAAPLHWLNLNWEVQPNLPKYKSRIDELQRHFFERPSYLKTEVRVVLQDSSCRPHKMVGSLLAYDPPELRDSLRQAVADAVAKGDDATLDAWRDVLLSVPMRFTVVEADQEHKIRLMMQTLVQEREDIGVLFDNLRVSALMRTFEVLDMKGQLEKDGGERQTNKTLAAHYQSLKYCKRSEKVSATFVEVSLSLHKNCLCYDRVRNVCLKFDELGLDNPLDSVHKLREIMIKCDKSRANMEWAFSMTWDWFHVAGGMPGDGKTKKDAGDAIPLSILEGTTANWGGKSLVNLFLFKRQIRDALWKKLEGYSWSTAVKERIRQLTIDVETCRENLGAIDVEVIGFQERSSWPESADALLLAIESLVYGYKKDDALVSCLKNRKGIEDTLAHADVKPLVNSIDTKYAKEQGVQDEESADEGEDDAEAKGGDGAEPAPPLLDCNRSAAEMFLQNTANATDSSMLEVRAKIETGMKQAERRVKGLCKLIHEKENSGDIEADMKDAAALTTAGVPKKYAVTVVDAKLLCENGRYRLPPTRQFQLTRLFEAV
ncbi:unnamed protein product [Symbiodinium sp. CCMP2592]|nr:unnamed protein product [Symbiodinium sp. CCMP2592]